MSGTMNRKTFLAIAAGMSAYGGNWIVGTVVIVAYRASSWLPQSQPKELLFGFITALATIFGFILALPVEHTWELDPIWLIAAGVISILYFAVALMTPQTFVSRCDYRDVGLVRARMVWTRLLTIGAGVAWLAWMGESGGAALATV